MLGDIAAEVFGDGPVEGGAAPAPVEVAAGGMVRASPVPAGLEGPARRLWVIRSRIDATRDALAQADADVALQRISSLTKLLTDLLEQEERLAPAPPPDEHAAERRWRSAADSVIAKIRAGIRSERERA
jgi:hypothetical protein